MAKCASPQDVGYQVVTQMQRKAKDSLVSSPFQARGAGDETRQKIVKDLMNIALRTTERLGQCSLECKLIFEEEPGFEAKPEG